MRIALFAAALLTGLTLSIPHAHADAAARQRFVFANLLFTVYHEAAHALVTDHNLPVGGPDAEERAADELALLLMIPDPEATAAEQAFDAAMLMDAVRGWLALAASHEAKDEGPHAPDRDRAQALACLAIGADAARFRSLAEDLDFSAAQRAHCRDVHAAAERRWNDWLTARRAGDLSGAAPQAVSIVYGEAEGWLAPQRARLEAWRFLDQAAEALTDRFSFARGFTLEAQSCGEANASWEPDERYLTLCYELAADFDALAAK